MTDRRLTLANDRVAHLALEGVIDAPHFAETQTAEISLPVVDLLSAPDGPRERQMLLGDRFDVLEYHEGFAYGRAARDGYCGYAAEDALCAPTGVSHWVSVPASHLYSEPRAQAPRHLWVSFGTRLRVLRQEGNWAETPHGFIPAGHLTPLGSWHSDPVEVAGLFLGTPYLWGGNSQAGIDCSGLVQMAWLACGRACPGDSDLQRDLGKALPDDAPLQRADLVFWKGHVAIMVDADLMIHATGHFMACVIEPAAEAIARIKAQTGLAPLARRRA
ncbi:MAG: NlpC/P60 family protein [Pseudorhodobacter sp.]